MATMSGMDQGVRRIEPADWPRFRRLRLEALRDSPLAFVEQHDQALAQPDAHWQERVGRGAGAADVATFVAVEAGELVGKATCFIEPEITGYVSAHLVGVYVCPPLRGRGVAEAVVAAAIGWARDEAHAVRVRLFVIETNDRAMAFYQRLGFAPTGATMAYPPDPAYTEYELARPV
jgi:GNAT superfamily N-acetyltransferase